MSRFENIAVFEDTVSVCEKSSRLIESIKASRNTQIFIGEKAAVLNFASSTNPGGGVVNIALLMMTQTIERLWKNNLIKKVSNEHLR